MNLDDAEISQNNWWWPYNRWQWKSFRKFFKRLMYGIWWISSVKSHSRDFGSYGVTIYATTMRLICVCVLESKDNNAPNGCSPQPGDNHETRLMTFWFCHESKMQKKTALHLLQLPPVHLATEIRGARSSSSKTLHDFAPTVMIHLRLWNGF